MVNRSKAKGTSTESLVVGYLREHGWPYAERRALSGNTDKGDVAGMPALAVEVKYGNGTLKIGPWLKETETERRNAGADYGILVVKPPKMGPKNVGLFYAVMIAESFDLLVARANGLFVIDSQPQAYSAEMLANEIRGGINNLELGPREVFAVALKPPGTKDKPEKWYRVMTLHHMTRLLRAAGYGDPELHERQA